MKKKCFYIIISLIFLLCSCHDKQSESITGEDTLQPVTPVTAVNITKSDLQNYIDLNATSVFRQKWIVKSNITGYLQQAGLHLNQFVSKGQVLFTIKTKEAASLGNTIAKLDSSFKFTGINTIRSNGAGFIAELNRQQGDYVQEGEQLAVITDIKSFVFILDIPYELLPLIAKQTNIPLTLPDGEKLDAAISNYMPSIDSASQTQRIMLKVNPTHPIPENLIGKVQLVKNKADNATVLPKACILTDENQSAFWVMKLINDSTAIKIPVDKGIETDGKVEIKSPVFSASDRILLTGNYGLSDTAKVKLVNTAPIQ